MVEKFDLKDKEKTSFACFVTLIITGDKSHDIAARLGSGPELIVPAGKVQQ